MEYPWNISYFEIRNMIFRVVCDGFTSTVDISGLLKAKFYILTNFMKFKGQ